MLDYLNFICCFLRMYKHTSNVAHVMVEVKFLRRTTGKFKYENKNKYMANPEFDLVTMLNSWLCSKTSDSGCKSL